jgi:predicted ATP-dependent endonuclease of OLD family
MRICKFEIRNFKGIQNASFDWEDIVVLIGENNCGKSTVLQALQCFLSGTQLKDPAFFRENLCDIAHAVELTAHFCDLSEIEQQAGAVRNRTVGDKWILKKKFWCEEQEGGDLSWKEQYFSYSGEESFLNWPENESSWANFPEEFQPLIQQLPDRRPKPNIQARDQLRQMIRESYREFLKMGEPTWVANPGGGGNWKSNANSIIPRCIYVKAVHDATDESTSKEASSYGKIVNLIIEKKLLQRQEFVDLKNRIQAVLSLFNPDPDHPELQAQEIRDLQNRINIRLQEIISGTVSIRTSAVEVESMLLPSTHLVLKDRPDALETPPAHQGHGLQRTLVMALLQILAELQIEPTDEADRIHHAIPPRAVILAVEEPELYMHPQMERKMRDVLYRLARQPSFQVICTTHSPVFLDVSRSHKAIVRAVKSADRDVCFFQASTEIFGEADAQGERARIQLIANFHPTINEVFFAKRVVLLEEYSSIVAFEKLAELEGLFQRHPHLRYDVALIDCHGKPNIPLFERILNHFAIPYTVVHDEDRGNPLEQRTNERIAELLNGPNGPNSRFLISPTDLEGLLNYRAEKDKVYKALKRVEELHRENNLPAELLVAMNWVYFGQANEPRVGQEVV